MTVPRSREEKFVPLFEAAKRSLLAAEMYLRIILEQLPVLEGRILSQELDGELVAPLLIGSMGFVDFAHRFGELIDQLPFSTKKNLELRKLKEVLVPIEFARHHLQHLRGELSGNEEINYPILGILSWSRESKSFSVYFSGPIPANAATMAFDTVNRRWASRIELNLKNTIIDLDRILAVMKATFSWITKKVTFSDPTFAKLEWGRTNYLVAEATLKPNGELGGLSVQMNLADTSNQENDA
jgi:hypothetical protein